MLLELLYNIFRVHRPTCHSEDIRILYVAAHWIKAKKDIDQGLPAVGKMIDEVAGDLPKKSIPFSIL